MREHILFRISKLNSDINYFYSLINTLKKDANLKKNIKRDAFMATNINSYHRTLKTFFRIINNLTYKKHSLNNRLRKISKWCS